MAEAVTCGSCGARIRSERPTCPRCRSVLKRTPAATVAPGGNKPVVLMGAALLGVAVLIAGGFWMKGGSRPQPPVQTALRPDAVAARPVPLQEAPVGTRSEPAVPVDRKFMEPQAEGAVAYADGNYAIALERYQAAIAKNPDDAEALSNQGQVLARLGRVEEAIPFFDRAIALIPQRWAYRFNRARALATVGRTAEAVAGYRDAQQLFPNDYATAFNLGLALHQLGDEAGAVDAYNRAIELDPNDATFRLALGTSLERLQRPKDAAAAYDDYLRLAPQAPDAAQVHARITQLTQPSTPPIPGQPGS